MRCVFTIFLLLTAMAWAQNDPVVFTRTTVHGAKINLVTIDLNSDDVDIRPILAPPGTTRSFQGLLNQGEGAAWSALRVHLERSRTTRKDRRLT